MPSESSQPNFKSLVVMKLGDNPAYLLIFGLAVVTGVGGLTTAGIGLGQSQWHMATIGLLSIVVAFAGAIIVVLKVEGRPQIDSMFLQSWSSSARSAFLAGRDACYLEGRWKVTWYVGFGKDKEPYGSNPTEYVRLACQGCRIMCFAEDPSWRENKTITYWMDGRHANHAYITLIYWSPDRTAVNQLVGTVFLRVHDPEPDGSRRMTGTWTAYTREHKSETGFVEWECNDSTISA